MVEGWWYGQPYPKPPARTRECVEILGMISARKARVEYQGMRYRPPNDGSAGQGKPLKNTMHPLRAELPIYLAAAGPENVALAAEMAEGCHSCSRHAPARFTRPRFRKVTPAPVPGDSATASRSWRSCRW